MTQPRPIASHLVALLAATLLVLCAWALPAAAQAQDAARDGGRAAVPRVDLLHVDGPITSVVAGYVERSLDDAEEDGTDVVVIRLDTPGGGVAITEEIMKRMLASKIPVVVWIGPEGAMAGSAGTFITLAAHLAAMAPGTSIGAASPIGPQGEELGETARAKMMNTLVTQMRNLAKRRGPQAMDWAEDAIRDARSSTDEEVLELRVIDLLARDVDDLLSQLDGRAAIVGGAPVALHTLGAVVREVRMSRAESLLVALASPNVAYILMTLGMMGLVYEFASPGFGLGGVVGSICLLLGVYVLGILPANYAGVGLMLLAFALFFADAKLGTGGLIAMGGVVSMVIGGMILFDSPIFAISPAVLWTTALACGAFFAFAASAVLRSQGLKATTGREGLVGAMGRVVSRLAPEGTVRVQGETWKASAADGPYEPGAEIEVTAVQGLQLEVRAAPDA